MKTLLAALSCAAAIACTGAAQAQDDLLDLLYFGPSLSIFDGAYAPEIGAGLKWRGVGDPRLNLSVEGSAALYQPGGAGELWAGSRLGFVVHEASRIEIVGSGSVGLIAGTPSYRGGLGIEVPLHPGFELVVEGVVGGHFGQSPTDNGVRVGLHIFPGAL